MAELKEFRDKIDEVDDKMVMLFEERMEIVHKIADYKEQNGIAILDISREREVIERGIDKLKNKDLADLSQKFFAHLMDLSKEEQENIME